MIISYVIRIARYAKIFAYYSIQIDFYFIRLAFRIAVYTSKIPESNKRNGTKITLVTFPNTNDSIYYFTTDLTCIDCIVKALNGENNNNWQCQQKKIP